MEIKKIILKTLREKKRITTKDIVHKTGFSRVYINRFFQELRDEGKIVLMGKANKAHYILANRDELLKEKEKILFFHRIYLNKGLQEDTVLQEIKKTTVITLGINKNILNIISYAFTEMLNNAIEHSQSLKVEVIMEREVETISFKIIDRGIGIFYNIKKKKNLKSDLEAVQDLLKGKQTTAPIGHSGEGIFFTSKAADTLTIQSSNKKLIFHNLLDDVFIRDIKTVTGTKVIFTINLSSEKDLTDIFNRYTHDDNSFEFSKTEVKVKLFKPGSEYLSRSQARRILTGLERFKGIVLDFKDIDTIGQGFADEIFRIWKQKNPKKEIIPVHMNENILFMINHVKQ